MREENAGDVPRARMCLDLNSPAEMHFDKKENISTVINGTDQSQMLSKELERGFLKVSVLVYACKKRINETKQQRKTHIRMYEKTREKKGGHKGGTLATSLWRTGGGDLYDKIFIWFYGCIYSILFPRSVFAHRYGSYGSHH